jgi:hypothetical protein
LQNFLRGGQIYTFIDVADADCAVERGADLFHRLIVVFGLHPKFLVLLDTMMDRCRFLRTEQIFLEVFFQRVAVFEQREHQFGKWLIENRE